jgi:hypothetical protein
LRRRFGPKRNKVTREWRKLHNEELNDLYISPNIVWVIKLRRMRWVGHVACMGERRGLDGRIIFKWISRKWDVGVWTGSSWLRIGNCGRHL